MPLFSYTAYARDGQQQTGQEFAQDRQDLEKRLKSRKLILMDSHERKLPRLQRSLLSRLISQLSPLLSSGIVIDRALQVISDDKSDVTLSDFAGQLRDSIKRGQQLSQSLQGLGMVDPLAMTVIRAGEASGQLAEVLQTLELHYQRAQKIRQEITAALIYPAVLVVLSLVSILVLAVYVVPTFKDLFQDRMTLLSWNTRAIFSFSDFILAYGWYLLAIIAAAFIVLPIYWRQSRAMRSFWSEKVLFLPVIGKNLSKIYTARVLSLLAVQLRNGVPLISALELITQSSGNLLVQKRMADIQNDVRRGKHLSLAMASFPNIPILALRFLAIGEETGQLHAMADKAGTQISDDVANRAKTMANLLGPMIILLMGLIIAFIVISMLVAVYSLTDLAPK